MLAFKRLPIVGPFPSCPDDVKVVSATFPDFFLFYWCDQESSGKGERWKQVSQRVKRMGEIIPGRTQNSKLVFLPKVNEVIYFL